MLWFLLRRGLFAIAVIVAVSVLVFTLARLIPASPALLVLGADAGEEEIAKFESQHGLNKPIIQQYGSWLAGIITHLDFGSSFVSGRPITREIKETLPVTLELILASMALCLTIAIPLGVVSAAYPNSVLDHSLRMFAVLGVSTPGFWLGLVLILTLSVRAGWFPPGDLPPISSGLVAHLRALVLPAFCLGIYYTAVISRMTRSSVLEVLNQDYVRTAVAMGISKRRIWLVYVLKNAMVPIISVTAMACGYMFGWAIVIEQVFNIPGICRALLAAIFSRDYHLVEATVLVVTFAFVALNFLADVAYRLLNPRVAW
jgi:peptide/nickel transport system permease protein